LLAGSNCHPAAPLPLPAYSPLLHSMDFHCDPEDWCRYREPGRYPTGRVGQSLPPTLSFRKFLCWGWRLIAGSFILLGQSTMAPMAASIALRLSSSDRNTSKAAKCECDEDDPNKGQRPIGYCWLPSSGRQRDAALHGIPQWLCSFPTISVTRSCARDV